MFTTKELANAAFTRKEEVPDNDYSEATWIRYHICYGGEAYHQIEEFELDKWFPFGM